MKTFGYAILFLSAAASVMAANCPGVDSCSGSNCGLVYVAEKKCSDCSCSAVVAGSKAKRTAAPEPNY